jgi:hypothetical protein
LAFGLERIDWSQPWFAEWREFGIFASELVDTHGSVSSALNVVACEDAKIESDTVGTQTQLVRQLEQASAAISIGTGTSTSTSTSCALKFVPQTELPSEQAYEAFIFDNKRIPTRDNLHDFLNGLCWIRFPHTKSRLNYLQAQEIAQQGVGSTRGSLRDALTLFDENVLLLQATDHLWHALQARDWKKLFLDLRQEWQSAQIVTFGHALLEKLTAPYKSITAHVYRIASDVNAIDDQALDDWLTSDLLANHLATKPFFPLPVLGIPGWWPDNEDSDFYADTQVFRLSGNRP